MIDVDIFTQPGFDKVNEDYVCHEVLSSGIQAIAVADGMGGFSFGDIAAKLTADTIVSSLKDVGDFSQMDNRISDSIELANDNIRRECEHRKVRMGASVAVAVINGNVCYYSSLGNVRVYILRDKKLRLLTEDHTNRIAGQSYLTRCVNGRPFRHKIVVKSIELFSGDELIIATDGYYIHNDVISENNPMIVDDDATIVKISVK